MVSGFVICYQAEKTIVRCLKSLAFCDEIIVVDSGSQDQTLFQIQDLKEKGLPIKLFYRPWTGFSDQKNYAMSLCEGDWIFTIDSDEAVTLELAQKIKEVVLLQNDISCYRIQREEYFLGKTLTAGHAAPTFQERLFKKDSVEYKGNIHEYPHLKHGAHGLIMEKILHDPDYGLVAYLNKMNTYTTLEALDRYKQGKRTTFAHIFLTLGAATLRNFFTYKAYKDGRVGFILSFLDGMSRSVRHLKIWILQNNGKL